MEQVLLPLRSFFSSGRHPEILVGLDVSDDAAVYKVSDEVAVIQTVDFFTPIVDDPHDYGAIAAANAMSDVFAMGGTVVLALNVCGFPSHLDSEVIGAILRGGAEKVSEAGAVIAGGHTVTDKELKYGLSVMGLVHPDRVITKVGAQPGDLLVLTKPLGVGIIATALKGQVAQQSHVEAAAKTMKELNKKAAELLQEIGVHACTDITGYALLGHAFEMAHKSGVRIRLHAERLPLIEGVRQYAEEMLFPGGTGRNQSYYDKHVAFAPAIEEETRMLLFTPETSGGLLFAVAGEKRDRMTDLFSRRKQSYWIVGEVHEGKGIEVD